MMHVPLGGVICNRRLLLWSTSLASISVSKQLVRLRNLLGKGVWILTWRVRIVVDGDGHCIQLRRPEHPGWRVPIHKAVSLLTPFNRSNTLRARGAWLFCRNVIMGAAFNKQNELTVKPVHGHMVLDLNPSIVLLGGVMGYLPCFSSAKVPDLTLGPSNSAPDLDDGSPDVLAGLSCKPLVRSRRPGDFFALGGSQRQITSVMANTTDVQLAAKG